MEWMNITNSANNKFMNVRFISDLLLDSKASPNERIFHRFEQSEQFWTSFDDERPFRFCYANIPCRTISFGKFNFWFSHCSPNQPLHLPHRQMESLPKMNGCHAVGRLHHSFMCSRSRKWENFGLFIFKTSDSFDSIIQKVSFAAHSWRHCGRIIFDIFGFWVILASVHLGSPKLSVRVGGPEKTPNAHSY